MIATNWITRTPKINLFSILIALFLFAIGISNFKLDASSETLLLENDPDLKLYRENTELYGSSDFLVVTFTPNETLISESVVTDIKSLVSDLSQIKGISSVLSLLDVPLIESNPGQSLSDVADSVSTLNEENIDIALARRVLSTNPVYKNLLISEDLKTTAFQLTLDRNIRYEGLINERYTINESFSESKQEDLSEINRLINLEKNQISISEKKLVFTI